MPSPDQPPLPPTFLQLTTAAVADAERGWARGRERMRLGGALALVGAVAAAAALPPIAAVAGGALALGGLALTTTGYRAARRARHTVDRAATMAGDPYLLRAAAELDAELDAELGGARPEHEPRTGSPETRAS
jgi:hypothetical protein